MLIDSIDNHLAEAKEFDRAAVPMGMYLAWCVNLGLVSEEVLREQSPDLDIACSISPPFRPLTAAEDADCIERIRCSGARLVFVGVGCPKQERWMAAHNSDFDAVMIGVGAAFDYISGATNAPPDWVHRAGLEWFYRLLSEPRRLWRRYLVQNPRFLLLCLRQKFGRA